MLVLREDDDAPASARQAVYAIGNFDGLHRGHQALFARAKTTASARNVPAGVLTFTPHPARVLAPEMAPPLILTAAEKERGIERAGIDVYALQRFDAELSSLSPAQFVERVVVLRLGASGVVVGEGFRFGHKAQGTIDDLRALLGPQGVSVDVVDPVGEGSLVCSSTKIRQLVLEGKVDLAARLLGRRYTVRGVVVAGDGRGRQLQVPTANLQTERELLPKVGVYATRAHLADGSVRASVTNVGLRPTFQGEGVRIETHIMDFSADLYGQQVEIELVERVRDEQRFQNVEALVARIREDIAVARTLLAGP